jgi:hypothetical protein
MTMRQQAGVRPRVALAGMPIVLVPMMVVGFTVGGCGEDTPAATPAADAMPSTHLPAGYALQLDRANRDRTDFAVALEGGDLVIEAGPAGILYQPDEIEQTVAAAASGRYRVHGGFTEIGAPIGHREGFGLFIGGQQLGGDQQRYVYFLVRGDGRYLVKQRDGDETRELSAGWQPSAAVQVPAAESGAVTNELVMEVADGTLRLLCNGEPVAEVMIDEGDTWGTAGVRVNHNLHVRVADFAVTRQ